MQPMAVFPRPSRPSVVWADLKLFFAQRQRHQLVFATLALAAPVLIIAGFVHDSHYEREYHPTITYVDNWKAGRSPEEIAAQQADYQKIKDAQQAELERRRAPFKAIDKELTRLGM